MRMEKPKPWKRLHKILWLYSHLHAESLNIICIVNKLVRKKTRSLQLYFYIQLSKISILSVWNTAEHADNFYDFDQEYQTNGMRSETSRFWLIT